MATLKTLTKDASVDSILEVLDQDGAVIVEDVMSEALADQIYRETIEYVEATRVGGDFTGHHTTRTGALPVRSIGACELVLHPTVLNPARAFLAPYCEKVQLHLTQIIRIKTGERNQPLHRDRDAWGSFLPPPLEPQLNAIWALTDFTSANGATRVAPGSHRWEYSRRAKKTEITQAEMSRGSVVIYSGTVIHGGGANTSGNDRLGINVDYSLGWLRQEENQFLSCPPELVKNMEPELQELIGYTMGSLACGYFSENKPAGEAKEVCPPEYALGRGPRPGMATVIENHEDN